MTETFRNGAAGFIGLTLNEADKLIEGSTYRRMVYKVQRHVERTLITTAGEIKFRDTLYRRKTDGRYEHLLSRMIGLADKERLSEGAEAEVIKEAVRSSCEKVCGALPVKSGCDHIPKSVSVLDKFHLTKYINRECGQMLGESDLCRSDIYRMLYKRKKKDFIRYTDRMTDSVPGSEAVISFQSYVLNNWEGIMTLLHDRVFEGCCAEGHVSHVLSERMSSRPMGWSRLGADRMSRLGCFVRDHGEGKIIELVRYRRGQRALRKTGTDGMEISKLSHYQVVTAGYDRARSYIERLQATIPGYTSRKSFAIRNWLRLI